MYSTRASCVQQAIAFMTFAAGFVALLVLFVFRVL